MVTAPSPSHAPVALATRQRAWVRYAAAAVSAGVGGAYVVLLLLVKDAEAGAPENTYGAYLFLAVPYLTGAVLALALDRRVVWVVGAVAQVAVLTLYALFGAGLWGPGQGVLDEERLSGLPMAAWSVAITAAEVLLLALLVRLAVTQPRPAQPPPAHA